MLFTLLASWKDQGFALHARCKMSASIHTTTSVASPIASSNVYNPDHSVAQSGGSGPGSTIGGVSEFWPLPPQIARNLNDRMYEKRKQAALEIEKWVYPN